MQAAAAGLHKSEHRRHFSCTCHNKEDEEGWHDSCGCTEAEMFPLTLSQSHVHNQSTSVSDHLQSRVVSWLS